MRRHRRLAVLAGLAAGALLLAGCSPQPGEEPTGDSTAPGELVHVDFQLNWAALGIHAGFAAAVEEGYYEEAGLDVTLIEGNGSVTTAQMIASNQVSMGYVDAAVVAQLADKGAAMRAVAAMYQASPYAVIALEETKLTSVAKLKGLNVGVPSGATQSALFPVLLEKNSLSESDVNLVNMPNSSLVPALLQGQVDAILGSTDSFIPQLRQQGAELDIFSFSENGVPLMSQSIVASDRFIVEHADVVTAFVAASLRGFAAVMDDPELGVAALKKVFPELNSEVAALELTESNLLMCGPDSEYVGLAPAEAWQTLQDDLAEVGLVTDGADPASYYSNAYLPAESELRSCSASTDEDEED